MSFARDLRNNPTPEERELWRALSFFRPRFTRQLKIGPFVADFACRRARLIVELDGSQHIDNVADVRRTALLEADGWRVLRLWNNEIHANLHGVGQAIADAVAARLPENEMPEFVASRAGRERRPRSREKKKPPLTPPRSRGGGLS
jgi:very-short-patch-repair endonuclease